MKVLAAMSGGVDSAVAAARAVEAGHEVVGVHLALSRMPGTLRTGTGNPYRVFSQFAKCFHRSAKVVRPLPAPKAPVVIDAATRNAIGSLARKFGLATGSEITPELYAKLSPAR